MAPIFTVEETMKVEELKQFGAPLEMPKEAVKQQGKIMLRALRRRFGIVGMLGIFKDTWHMESYTDDPDKLTLNITTCANVELFGELGVPELGKFGCDHDLAGYAAIEDDVDCDFRRLCTIAKGDPTCVFEFYRKGTAPDNAHLNKWARSWIDHQWHAHRTFSRSNVNGGTT
jgi:hypothetical protein